MRYTCSLLGRNGRLGNQLFQIAGTLGRAARSGDIERATLPEWPYREFFSIPASHFAPVGPDERTVDLGRAFAQDLDEFAHCTDLVRAYFAPSTRASDLADEIFPDVGPTHVAVHVRRGDYTRLQRSHPLLRVGYFRRALGTILERFSAHDIDVFSDDPAWCDAHLDLPGGRIHHESPNHSSRENEVASLVAMSRCGAHVISNSTFGWWGAWLAGSTAVAYPDPWFGPDLAHLAPLQFIPVGWEAVDSSPDGPMRTPGLHVDEGPTGLIVTNHSARRVHHLNAAASVVFELCSGNLPESEIGEILANDAPGLDWRSALSELRLLGLVSK